MHTRIYIYLYIYIHIHVYICRYIYMYIYILHLHELTISEQIKFSNIGQPTARYLVRIYIFQQHFRPGCIPHPVPFVEQPDVNKITRYTRLEGYHCRSIIGYMLLYLTNGSLILDPMVNIETSLFNIWYSPCDVRKGPGSISAFGLSI